MQAIVTVPFYGESIITIETDEDVFVPVKPICERLGLAWQSQLAKLRGAQQRWGITLIVIPSSGGAQEMACLPLRKIAGWLATIAISRVKDEAKAALALYQAEADTVLDRHFRLRDHDRRRELDLMALENDRLRAVALAANPLWNRIVRLQEAGCELGRLATALRRSQSETDRICALMEASGVLDMERWPERRLRVAPMLPLDEIIARASEG
jgi:hypothetical protein